MRDVKLSVDNVLDCLECLWSCDYKAAGVFVFWSQSAGGQLKKSRGKTNTRHLNLSPELERGDEARDRLSPGHIMSPPAPNMSLVKVMSHYKQSHCFHHRTDIKTQVVEREGAGCRGMCSIWLTRSYQTQIVSSQPRDTRAGYQGIEAIHDSTLHPDISTS